MNRRYFLKLAMGSCALPLAFPSSSGHSLTKQIDSLNIIFSELFPPGLISASIEEDINQLPSYISEELNFNAEHLINMVLDADKAGKQTHGRNLTELSPNEQKQIVEILMTQENHIKTYRNVRDILFGKPIYLFNRDQKSWFWLGYQEHQFIKQGRMGQSSFELHSHHVMP